MEEVEYRRERFERRDEEENKGKQTECYKKPYSVIN